MTLISNSERCEDVCARNLSEYTADELLNLQPGRTEYEGDRPGLDLLRIREALQELMT